MSVRYFVISLLFCSITTKFAYHQANIFQENEKTRDSPNVPCSAERSDECSVIFGEFCVLIINRGTGEGEKEPLFGIFTTFLIFFQFYTFFSDFIFTQAKNLIFKEIRKFN